MDDLIAEFLTETNEGLGELDNALVSLEQNPNDRNLITKIFRVLHTIKGTCGFLGLPRLEKVAHKGEDVLGLFRDEVLKVTPEYISLILEALDTIKLIINDIEQTGKEPAGDDSALISKLEAVYNGQGLPAQDPAAALSIFPEPPDDILDSTPAEAPALATTNGAAPSESSLSSQSLRVSVDVLETLMTMVSELVLTRNQLLQILRLQKESEFAAPLQRLSHVVSDLQEGVMKTRMQPIGNAWAKLPRIVRDISKELGKKIDLEMHGQDTELDRQVLEMIKDPLTHMVRNSADHGLELPHERKEAGKPETGKIKLNSYHEGGHIIIEIADDGRGLPLEKIKAKIIKNGLASEAELAAMSQQQIYQYIFRAGFSTAEKVTAVSGRGVGMDVVRTNIEKIGGSIELRSVEGKGTTFIIKIPLTLAIVSALIVGIGGERFAIPQLAVRELVMTNPQSDNRIETINNTPVFRLRDRLLPLVSLDSLLGLDKASAVQNNKYIIVTQIGPYSLGVIVDKVFDTEEIVVKPVTSLLRSLDIFSGNTILGDGTVIMILDPSGILKATNMTDMPEAQDAANDQVATTARNENETSLLLFSANDDSLKAAPLDSVARLEEIDLARIERANGATVIQYRGGLMPVFTYDGSLPSESEGRRPVIVFTFDDKPAGLLVDRILDITTHDGQFQIRADGKLMGSAIINQHTTDIINPQWFAANR